MSNEQEIRKIFGYHLALDLYNCNPEVIRNIENCYYYLAILPEIIETGIQSPPFVIYKKDIGFSGWIPVVESGISLYAYFSTNFISIDIYTCKKFDHTKVKKFTVDLFKPKKIKEYYFLRGKEYVHPVDLLRARGFARDLVETPELNYQEYEEKNYLAGTLSRTSNTSQANQKETFGYYLMLDLYNCKPKAVGDIKKCYSYLDELSMFLGIEKLSPPFIIYTDEKKYPDKAGLSGWIPFADHENKLFTGASIHTLTPTNFISIDIYSCRKINQEKTKKFTLKVFRPSKVEVKYLLRGRAYIPSNLLK